MKKSAIPTMVLAAFMGCLLLTGCGDGSDKGAGKGAGGSDLEKAAAKAFDKVNSQAARGSMKCTRVRIMEKFNANSYVGMAYLTAKIDVLIEKRGDEIHVEPAPRLRSEYGKSVSGESALEKAAVEKFNQYLEDETTQRDEPISAECTGIEITEKSDDCYVGKATVIIKIVIMVREANGKVEVAPLSGL